MKRKPSLVIIFFALFFLFPTIGYGDVHTTLESIQRELIGKLLPLAATLGLVAAGFSFVMGHENARKHLQVAIFGAIIGFGAPHIMRLIQSLVH